MINQAEGGALPLTCTPSSSSSTSSPPSLLCPPAQFPGRFDYNLWRTLLTAKPLKMCWQMRWTGQLVKPRGCRRLGRVGQSDRGREWMEKEQKEQQLKERGEEIALKDHWSGKRRKQGEKREDSQRPKIIQKLSGWLTGRLAGRAPGWLYWSEEYIHCFPEQRAEQDECVQEGTLGCLYHRWHGKMYPGPVRMGMCLIRLKLSC